jgi:hypothetical protein
MKAIVLSRKHRSEIINILSNRHSHEDYIRVENAIGWLTHGSKEVNPFDVFGPHERELIIEALEHTAEVYRHDGDPEKLERAKKFEAIARQARTASAEEAASG